MVNYLNLTDLSRSIQEFIQIMFTYLIQSKLPTAILKLLAMLLIISNSSTYKFSYYKRNKLRENILYINNNSLGINDRPKLKYKV
jgi:hypothetical protein